ncbi:MAG TPA: hypothetical protein PKW90_23105, partial [Myxococcota bacterium]|nr:hypothetical protein [Myxococcota bacterium]
SGKGFTTKSDVDTIVGKKGFATAADVDTIVGKKGFATAADVDTIVGKKGFATAADVDTIVSGKGFATTKALSSAIGSFITESTARSLIGQQVDLITKDVSAVKADVSNLKTTAITSSNLDAALSASSRFAAIETVGTRSVATPKITVPR